MIFVGTVLTSGGSLKGKGQFVICINSVWDPFQGKEKVAKVVCTNVDPPTLGCLSALACSEISLIWIY